MLAHNPSAEENEAFLYLSRHFLEQDLPVPRILHIAEDRLSYIVEDLGDTTLFSILERSRGAAQFEQIIRPHYRRVIEDLIAFQTRGARGIDFSRCYPLPTFDRNAIQWDLSYFKYYFLRLAGIEFNEARLQAGFDQLTDNLLQQPAGYFMHRDFQSRNIMLKDGQYVYIDYQGGRSGPLSYDLASLLFNSRADLSPAFREEMLDHYIQSAGEVLEGRDDSFRKAFRSMAVLRVLQAMGAYGYRGYFQRKALFLSGIPFGLRNLASLLGHPDTQLEPYLMEVLLKLSQSPMDIQGPPTGLTLWIQSFSYRYGIPADPGGHGGGFVFDCRALPNPGRDPSLAGHTGRDAEVAGFLEGRPEVEDFLQHALALVRYAVEQYLSRGFDSLSVSFGCTGGRHRSVYCAERLNRMLDDIPGLNIRLRHLQQGELGVSER